MIAGGQKTKGAQPIGHRDEYHLAGVHEILRTEHRRASGARKECAAMNEHDDGQQLVRLIRRPQRPIQIQIQAVFGTGYRLAGQQAVLLDAIVLGGGRIANMVPRQRFDWVLCTRRRTSGMICYMLFQSIITLQLCRTYRESQRSDRRLGKRNTVERIVRIAIFARLLDAAQPAVRRLDERMVR